MRGLMTAAAAALLLAGCNKQPVECTAQSASAPVVSIVKDELEKTVTRKLRGDDGEGSAPQSKIRAAIAQLVISLNDIRTSREDPNSTKRFCAATLKIRIPSDLLRDADSARASLDLGSVSDLANNADIDRAADTFSAAIEFNVQPTDDGSKVFAETESGTSMLDFTAEVLSSGLLHARIADNQRNARLLADQQAAAQNAALSEQKAANLGAAKTENQLAAQTIAAAWKAIPAERRSQMLALQRAWIRKKDADCKVEAASASIDPSEMEVARLNCDTRVTNERIQYLAPFRSEEAEPAADEETN